MTNRNRRTKMKLPPFVALTWDVLNSPAYKELKPSAAKALPYFLGKPKTPYRDPQCYTIEFALSYSEGRRYGFANATFSTIIQALVSTGFIDPVDKGGLRSDGRSYNRFKLSERWMRYGKKDFEAVDWRCFKPRMKTKSYCNK